MPILEGMVAWFACKTQKIIDAGDYLIILGEVEDFAVDQQQGERWSRVLSGQLFSLGK